MTRDFPGSPDPTDDSAVDADIALITAYLARELSLAQIVAVEERLETDASFLQKVQPVLDAWLIPVRFGPRTMEESSSRIWAANTLTPAEIEDGWQRYIAATIARRTQPGPRPVPRAIEGPTNSRRRRSMTRIAAVFIAVVLPVATFAQVVVYAAKRVDMPGHLVARRIIAPFVDESRPSAPRTEPRTGAMPVADDAPLVRPLPLPAPAERRARGGETTASVVVATPDAGTAVNPPRQPTPNRARIAALATEHQAAVVRGDTAADYILMVVNAANEYVWSTHGIGGVSVEVGGDTRTSAERSAYNREHRAELTGSVGGTGGGGSGGGRGGRVLAQPDTARVATRTGTAGGGGGGGGGGRVSGLTDTVARETRLAIVALDSVRRYQVGVRGGAVSGGYRGEVQGAAPGSYRVGWMHMRNGELVTNRAHGLQDAGDGESGIQGLPSTSVALADLYSFAAGSLAPQYLRVLVVHLTPGTVWSGR